MALGDTPRVMRPFGFRAAATLGEAPRSQPPPSKPRLTRWRQNMPEDVRFPAPAINRPSRKKWSVRRIGLRGFGTKPQRTRHGALEAGMAAARSSHAASGTLKTRSVRRGYRSQSRCALPVDLAVTGCATLPVETPANEAHAEASLRPVTPTPHRPGGRRPRAGALTN